MTANEEGHRRLRRVFSRAFSKPALAAQESLITHKVDLLIANLRQAAHARKRVNMVDMLCFVIFDIMADLMFYESLNLPADENSPNASWMRSVLGYTAGSICLDTPAKFTPAKIAWSLLEPRLVATYYGKFLKTTGDKG